MPLSEIWALIPARGGSKGLPGKNLLKIKGIPLIGRAINSAISCDFIDRVFTSSDDHEILTAARRYGSEIRQRSTHAATDSASTESVIEEFLVSQKQIPKILVLIQPTNPFVRAPEIKKAIDLLLANTSIDTVFSAKPFHGFLWFNERNDLQSAWSGVNHNHLEQRNRRQDIEKKIVIEDGGFYVIRVSSYVQCKNRFGFHAAPLISPFPWCPEIDSLADYEINTILADYLELYEADAFP